MTYVLLTVEVVELLRDAALNLAELRGRAGDTLLEGTLARVDNRMAYGPINDVFDLGAAYAAAIAQGHFFNDGNKCTAFRAMNAVLAFNGFQMSYDTQAIGHSIISAAQGKIGAGDLADWLRARA